MFRVEVEPAGIPSSRINWRAATGSATFPSGTNGTETVVLGSSGMVDLEVNVLVIQVRKRQTCHMEMSTDFIIQVRGTGLLEDGISFGS